MSLRLYMDEHIRSDIAAGLRTRGVDVITAQDEFRQGTPDPALLDRATDLGRVMVSQDKDMLRETTRRLRVGEHFTGLIYIRQLQIPIGQSIEQIELIAKVFEPDEIQDGVQFVPIRGKS